MMCDNENIKEGYTQKSGATMEVERPFRIKRGCFAIPEATKHEIDQGLLL